MDNLDLESLTTQQLELLLEQKKAATTLVFADVNSTGQGLPTPANTHALLKFYNIRIRYNEMTKDTDIDIPGVYFSADTETNAKLEHIRGLARTHRLNPSDLFGHITVVANHNAYHPVREWIDSHAWDGQDRLQLYYDSIELEQPNAMKETMMRKWVLSLVAALYHPNFSCEGVLTLQSPQGRGKTISIENILPAQYRSRWNKDAVVIDMRDKDSIFKALQFWIAELGEVDATFRKSDMEALKGFITEKTDVLRPPYERKSNRYPRRTVFYATVNQPEFLQDVENRRFWVLAVRKFHSVAIDAAQFWAQIKHMYESIRDKISTPAQRELNNEYGWFMSPDERQTMHVLQEFHRAADPIEQLLDKQVILSTIKGLTGEWMNITDILGRCGKLNPNKRDLNTGADWLRSKGFKPNGNKQFNVLLRVGDQPYQYRDDKKANFDH